MTHLIRNIVCSMFLLTVACSAKSIEIFYGRLDPTDTGSPAIVLRGEIRTGDYEIVKRFARLDTHKFHSSTVVLASSGGDLVEAIRIGNFFRRTYMSVFVNPAIGRCASACFLIYVAAVERGAMVPGLGIHRPYFPLQQSENIPLDKMEQRHRTLSASVKRYLEEQQVPQYLIERMFSMASTEISWLDREDLNSLGARAVWWDQVLVDRCKLNKELEQEYLKNGDESPRVSLAKEHLFKVAKCSYDISADERLKNLKELLALPK